MGYYIRFRDRPLSLEEVMAGLRPVDGGLLEDEIEEFREEAAEAGGAEVAPRLGRAAWSSSPPLRRPGHSSHQDPRPGLRPRPSDQRIYARAPATAPARRMAGQPILITGCSERPDRRR